MDHKWIVAIMEAAKKLAAWRFISLLLWSAYLASIPLLIKLVESRALP